MPKLSIIIPTFNSGATIERCLDSIGRQTFTDYEVVIQDGGSADRTLDAIRSWQQTNGGVRIELQQVQDKGAYDAMNKGIQRASGEWLYFLGSDDELYDARVLENTVGSPDALECDVLYGNVLMMGRNGVPTDGTVYDGPFDLKKLLHGNICHQAIFYKADTLKKIGSYNLDYVICADWDLNMRCFANSQFKYVDTIVAKFNTGGLSSQHRPDTKFIADIARNVMQYFHLSADDPRINNPAFVGYSDIVRMQRSPLENALRALVRKK